MQQNHVWVSKACKDTWLLLCSGLNESHSVIQGSYRCHCTADFLVNSPSNFSFHIIFPEGATEIWLLVVAPVLSGEGCRLPPRKPRFNFHSGPNKSPSVDSVMAILYLDSLSPRNYKPSLYYQLNITKYM